MQARADLPLPARAVSHLVELVGDLHAASRYLRTSAQDLERWLRGQAEVPRMAFLRAVDFLISDLEARERARARPGAVAAPSRRVLVVDDNVDSAVSLAVLLRNMRHYVEVVHDGHAALSTARAFRPDFVLLDIGLPGLDGFQVAAALRRDPGLAAATIVAVTGLASESDRRRSAEAGFDHYLVKPLDVAYIASLLGGGLLEYRRAL